MAKNIEVPVDDEAYEALVEEAERTGTTVPELAGRVLARDAVKHRFLTAASNYATAWGPAFDETFGPARSGGAAA